MNIYVSYVIVNSFVLKLLVKYKAFALTGRIAHCHYTQGAALGYELLPFQGVLLIGALPFQGVLLIGALPFQGVLLIGALPFQGVLLIGVAALSYPSTSDLQR